jgi:hypothetical protein
VTLEFWKLIRSLIHNFYSKTYASVLDTTVLKILSIDSLSTTHHGEDVVNVDHHFNG